MADIVGKLISEIQNNRAIERIGDALRKLDEAAERMPGPNDIRDAVKEIRAGLESLTVEKLPQRRIEA